MRLDSPAHFAAALSETEMALGVRYPANTPQLLSELSTIVGSPKHHGVFERARLLVTPADVTAPRDELGGRLVEGYLLPFLIGDDDQWPSVYGFEMAGVNTDRIAVYSVHTIVESWADSAAFLKWVSSFKPPSRQQPP